MYNIGEKPGKGVTAALTVVGVTLDGDNDRLPPCGKCGKGQQTTYNRC